MVRNKGIPELKMTFLNKIGSVKLPGFFGTGTEIKIKIFWEK